ncbi:MAG TPA: hypothetical protein ENN03_07050 [bacterium]|nr:hypothetical protein [bacterium]
MASINIDPETNLKTDQCIFGKCCLKGKTDHMCRIERAVMENGLFLVEQKGENCPYFLEFGFSLMCHCPIRIEIFNKYHY